MTVGLEKIYEAAMELSDESKAILVERIVEHLGMNVAPDIEQLHLDIVKRRKDEVAKGQAEPLDGQEVSLMMRRILAR